MTSNDRTPTPDLPQLRRQRAALDAEIRRREDAEQEDYNTRLDELYDAVMAFAGERGLTIDRGERKNVVSVGMNGVITVEFGYHRPGMGRQGLLTVSDASAGMQAEFGGHDNLSSGLPTVGGLLGLIAGQLDAYYQAHPDQLADRDGRLGSAR